MKKVALFLFLSVCFAQQSCSSDSVGTEPEENPQDILFKDDFNFFDEKVWTKETHEPGWTNQELQAYDAAHVSVGKDGDKSVLILTAERKGNKIYSGRINSKGKKNFKYRKIEASIKLPKTNGGLWPAFWMMGDNDKQWPACGEIDIMEMGEQSGMAAGDSGKTSEHRHSLWCQRGGSRTAILQSQCCQQSARRQLSHLLSGLG